MTVEAQAQPPRFRAGQRVRIIGPARALDKIHVGCSEPGPQRAFCETVVGKTFRIEYVVWDKTWGTYRVGPTPRRRGAHTKYFYLQEHLELVPGRTGYL